MSNLIKKNSVLFLTSSLITLLLFLTAGNLISIEQPASISINLDSINFSETIEDKSETKNNIISKQPTDQVKTTSENNPNSSNSYPKTTPSEFYYNLNEKLTNQKTMLSLEGDYFPLFKLKPDYPSHALAKGREGVCLVNYTINTDGTVSGISVVESECDPLFHKTSIHAAKSFVYKPRIKNGMPQEVKNVRNKFVFRILQK